MVKYSAFIIILNSREKKLDFQKCIFYFLQQILKLLTVTDAVLQAVFILIKCFCSDYFLLQFDKKERELILGSNSVLESCLV
ncbi:MAG: hypothetical protein DWQ05_11005 [Calditrichaeota bacterium]|nr:MAG: hypothetical protein DWQ05_11005 [Calditrichota bacterium]